MRNNVLRTAIAAVAVSSAVALGSGVATATPSPAPAPTPVVQPEVQPVMLTVPLVAAFGPFAPLVAGFLCIPTVIVLPFYPVCVV